MRNKISLFLLGTKQNPSIRRILIIILLHAIAPAIFIIMYITIAQGTSVINHYQDNLAQITRLIAHNLEHKVLKTQTILFVVSKIPGITSANSEQCAHILKQIQSESESLYTGVGVTDREGNVVCSSADTTTHTNVADRKYFTQAKETQSFSLGNYQIGVLSGKPVIVAAYPIMEKDIFQGIVFAGFDLTTIHDFVGTISLPDGFTVTLLDQTGKIISRYPNPDKWIGYDSSQTGLGKTILSETRSAGTFTATGLEGTERIYTFQQIRQKVDAGVVYIVLGTPKSEVNKIIAAEFLRNSIIIIGIILSAIIILSIDLHLIFRRLQTSESSPPDGAS